MENGINKKTLNLATEGLDSLRPKGRGEPFDQSLFKDSDFNWLLANIQK